MEKNEPSEGTFKMEAMYPICQCGAEVKQIRYLDYEGVRVVFHAGPGCVLGVMPAPDLDD